jgi:hypothetical protein
MLLPCELCAGVVEWENPGVPANASLLQLPNKRLRLGKWVVWLQIPPTNHRIDSGYCLGCF